MPSVQKPATERLAVALSHATKIRAFYECIRESNPESDAASFFLNEATELLETKNFALLRAYAKELDITLRETLEPDAQRYFVQRMVERGVMAEHLPKLASVKALRAILRRGSIRNEGDLSVVRAALDSNMQGQMTEAEMHALGVLFDLFTSTSKAEPQGRQPKGAA